MRKVTTVWDATVLRLTTTVAEDENASSGAAGNGKASTSYFFRALDDGDRVAIRIYDSIQCQTMSVGVIGTCVILGILVMTALESSSGRC
jgi:hypothetical protein